ncbi:hypothetical protein ORL43_15820 [Klebsiella michiganensis]|uniref:hypothetical protein n=1 Tax=Klebsiella michiganensis TaxID=1134687 RepID=UPI0006514EAC|nr:hypothetical protein [Klebsiella michiganensis]EKV4194668.1 hypothetical protein [Klebsiella michiganensis]KMK43042.1 hypothetical protein ABW14_12620 [Klebsiella michiganensis]MBX4659015.1 hypothetical protein [Klebsiella michiganensis]MCW9466668.1 hypothetical protein [Klebsiella michiganensis]MCW9614514.1 hypothetical protein [Klebsiella michiganensis]
MSLIVDTTFKGISVGSAKVTIGDIYIADGHAVLSITANWSAPGSSEFFRQTTYNCPYDITGADPVTQAYTWLKTLDEFVGATES